MEYVLIARISFRQHGDYSDIIKHVDLGDTEIQSKEDIERVARKISEELKITEELHYVSCTPDYPTDSEFYLETKEDQEGYGLSDMYKVQLIDCIRIKGRLFELQPLDI